MTSHVTPRWIRSFFEGLRVLPTAHETRGTYVEPFNLDEPQCFPLRVLSSDRRWNFVLRDLSEKRIQVSVRLLPDAHGREPGSLGQSSDGQAPIGERPARRLTPVERRTA